MIGSYTDYGTVPTVFSLQHSCIVRIVHNDRSACLSILSESNMYDSTNTFHIKMCTK